MFASNGAVFAALLPWYPLLTDRLALSAVQFGVIVAAFAVGAIVSSALPAPLIARFGPNRVAVVGTVFLAAAIAAAGWSPNGVMLAVCIFLAGFLDAIVDVAQNLAGIRVQDAAGRSILSSLHALWSLGGIVGGVASTTAAALGLDVRLALAVIAASCVVLVAIGATLVGDVARNPAHSASAPVRAAAPGRWRTVAATALPLVLVAVCGTMVEDVGNNWGALSGQQLAGLPVGAAGVVFIVVVASQCIGRFLGDAMIDRWGRVRVARAGGALIALGGALVVLTDVADPGPLLVGFALVGFGGATLVPSAYSAAARIPGVSEGAGVTIVSWLMRVGFLFTSPLIGAIAEAADLRWGLGILILVGAATIALAGALAPAPRGSSPAR